MDKLLQDLNKYLDWLETPNENFGGRPVCPFLSGDRKNGKLKIISELTQNPVKEEDEKRKRSNLIVAQPQSKDQKTLTREAIIQCAERSMAIKEIADALGLSAGTIRNHIIDMQNEGISLPSSIDISTREGLSNKEIQYRVKVIKNNPYKNNKQLSLIIGCSRSSIVYFKRKYQMYL